MQFKPMLASPLAKGNIVHWPDWVIEEKFDGHRLIVHVNGRTSGDVEAYSRPRKDGRMLSRELPIGLAKDLAKLPRGVYDGELLAGDTATDVKRTDLEDSLRFVLFDVIQMADVCVTATPYEQRRTMLEKLTCIQGRVQLSLSKRLTRQDDVTRFVEQVWKRGGEGAILKRLRSTYQVNTRSKDWLKIKRVEHFTLKVVGFGQSRGSVRFPGHPFAIVKLRDDEGHETTCKTKNDEELKALEDAWTNAHRRGADDFNKLHPALGRMLIIECGGRTRDGGYKGPVIWDRWEDE